MKALHWKFWDQKTLLGASTFSSPALRVSRLEAEDEGLVYPWFQPIPLGIGFRKNRPTMFSCFSSVETIIPLGCILFPIYFSAPFPFRISCQAVSRVQQTILQSGLLPPWRKVPSPFPACNIIPAFTFSPSSYLTNLFQSRWLHGIPVRGDATVEKCNNRKILCDATASSGLDPFADRLLQNILHERHMWCTGARACHAYMAMYISTLLLSNP